jgi:hypothetical protein
MPPRSEPARSRFVWRSALDPNDALTFGAVVLLLGGVALAASAVPAIDAARVDLMLALKSE